MTGPQPPRAYRADDGDDREELAARARRELKFSGVAFQVMGWFEIGGGIFYTAIGVWCAVDIGPVTGPQVFIPVGIGLAMFCPAILLIVAGRQMLRPRRYGLCLTGAAVAALPVNVGLWPISLPFAVVAFVVLTRPHVKRAFLFSDPEYDPDAG